MDTASVIQVENIVTRFGDKYIHQGVSFSVSRGSIVALIGGSGTGKSVLLREILGLLRPTSGSAFLFGVDVWNSSEDTLAALKQRFGVLFQNGALFSALNVGDNVAVPLREQRGDLSEELIGALVQLRLSLAGLTVETAMKMPSELSGGMRKRVALARALVLEPEILFLDEPTSGLDPINARAFDSLVRTLSENLGLTVMLVTHDLDTLRTVPDKIVALGEGKVLGEGSVEEVMKINHPWIKEYFLSDRRKQDR